MTANYITKIVISEECVDYIRTKGHNVELLITASFIIRVDTWVIIISRIAPEDVFDGDAFISGGFMYDF
jgi:hypothetical protein